MYDEREVVEMSRRPRGTQLDLRDMPAYGLAEAAHYLGLSTGTLRSWVVGRDYPTKSGVMLFAPIILPAGACPLRLSFTNIVEAQVLSVIRKVHAVPLEKVRSAVRYMEYRAKPPHPLAHVDFLTDGQDLFHEVFGDLVNASRWGQLALPDVLTSCLLRIERDAQGLASRLYPARPNAIDAPRVVVIDPGVSFGRASLAGTGIPVAVLAERHRAGETIEEIAEDYGRAAAEIAQAIEWEEAA